jgi:hypothetical protein
MSKTEQKPVDVLEVIRSGAREFVKLLQQTYLLSGKTMIGLGFGARLRFPLVCNTLRFLRVRCFLLSTCVLVYTCKAFPNLHCRELNTNHPVHVSSIYLPSSHQVCLTILPR